MITLGVAENIKILRNRYGLDQQDLADIAGVTNKAVSAWETGKKEPRMGSIQKIANRFNLKISNLIEDGGMEMVAEEKASYTVNSKEEDWTEEELEELERFKEFLRSKRN